MMQTTHPPMTTEGEHALRQSTHQDHEPGLEMIQLGSIAGGVALLAYGMIRRRRFTDLLYTGIGAALIARGVSQSDFVNRSFKRLALHTNATEPVEIAASMTVEKPVDEVYSFWRNLENLPRFLRHIDSIEMLDDQHSRWIARLPTGVHLRWTAEIIEDQKGELLAWQSVEGSDVFNEGYVVFRPVFDDQGTEIHARIVYHPPAGEIGARVATFFNSLQEMVVREDLRSFKRLFETGEMPTIEGQPSARGKQGNGRIERMMR